MQEFYINKDSVLPILRMELIYDGRSDFHKFWDAIQNSTITFSMININTGITKIANAPAYIKLRENTSCVEEYVICYDWKKRDTKENGIYKGIFTITFNDNITSDTLKYPSGDLIMPIREDLQITIK